MARPAEVTVLAVVRLGMPVLPAGLAGAAGHLLAAPPGVTALAASLLAASVLAAVLATVLTLGSRLRPRGLVPHNGRVTAFRAKSRPAVPIRQRDPDAPGHSRPRAPSAAPAAA